jgi:hypothetical protein
MQRIQIVRKTSTGFESVHGNPTVLSLDTTKRAPLLTLLSASWTDADRVEFGIYKVDVMPPDGQFWTGTFDEGAGGEPVPVFTAKTVTTADVIRERERRLAEGFDHDFQDARGVHRIGTTERDMIGWDEVTKWAQAKLALGLTADTKTIVTDSGPADITPLEWFEIINAADAFRGPLWQASFALQGMDPIPANYTDNSWWTPE